MTRVCRETNLNFGARRKFPNGAITEMIFHVAIAGDQIGNVVLAELGEDDAQRFFQEIRQHVQSTAVRHAHANFFHGSGRTFVQNRIENHHQRFRALQAKSVFDRRSANAENTSNESASISVRKSATCT